MAELMVSAHLKTMPKPTPTPKPRNLSSFRGSNGVNFPKKNPVPLPRKSLAENKKSEVPNVRLRPVVIRRETHLPIFMERERLERILEARPCSYPSTSSNNFNIELNLDNFYSDSECGIDEIDIAVNSVAECETMSARAIAAARSRGNDRPLSAYEESVESSINRRRASVAVMPLMELEYRNRMVAGSCNSLMRHNEENVVEDERTFSPDFGAIRVQVEDITTLSTNLVDDEIEEDCGDHQGETSTETISELNNIESVREGRQRSNEAGSANSSASTSGEMSICNRVVDWAVPSEYACSPIAQELNESAVDERPRPPIPVMYINTIESCKKPTTSAVDENSGSTYSDFVFRRNSSTSSSNSHNTVTLLEQIIRTRTIWYLPHLGRPEVLHLLRKMEPGNFIVRASTRENCMALSARMPPGSNIETDHYIIEKLVHPANPGSSVTTNVVRLEGSPRTFRSLPDLIQHYCLNDEELEVRLQLPSVIRSCTTTKQLLSIALMEQDFWTNEMPLSRKPSRSLSRTSVASSRINNNTLPKCLDNSVEHASTWFMGNDNGSAIYDKVESVNKYSNKEQPHSNYYAVHDTLVPSSKLNNNHTNSGLLTPEMSSNDGSLKTTKKRRSSSHASSGSSSRFATVCIGEFDHDRTVTDRKFVGDDETDSGLSSHSPPSKHDRIDNVQISRNERRSQSVRSNKSVNSPSLSSSKGGVGSSQTIARSSRPRSFLRSLLSFGTSTSTKDQRKNSVKESDLVPTTQLANCEYFTPWERSITPQVRTSRSAFDITNPPSRGFFGGIAPKKRSGVKTGITPSVSVQNTVDIFDDDNYTKGWKEATYNSDMTAASVKGSPGGKSTGSDGLKTFKPPSYDDVTAVSSRTRPLSMRRERSELNGIGMMKNNAQRLAYHNESSPGPATMGNGRVPMTPPVNANDPQIIKNCVEELRRKRLQSTNEMLGPQDSVYTQINPRSEGVHSAHASPQISMRRRNGFPSPSFSRSGFAGIDRHRGAEHRLSVPNLIAVTDPLIPGNVGQSARALRERIGRDNDGELMVINEGLVTPVVRRKNFATSKADSNRTSSKKDVVRIAEVEGVAVAAGEVAKRKQELEALLDRKKHEEKSQFDSMSSGSDQSSLGRKANRVSGIGVESELIWRRAKQQQQTAKLESLKTNGPTWSAVNYELKNRQQKVAKVLPTPQPRSAHLQQQRLHSKDRMTVGGCEIANVSSRRSSDYAQLCECSTSMAEGTTSRGMHLDVHSKIEDDAVSVAGTVFNEPWDSNVWENLLDLAQHGDENVVQLKVSEVIEEEDSDSDRTASGESTCQMDSEDDDEDEELRWPSDDSKEIRRPLQSDRVIVKGWEQDKEKDTDESSTKYSTLDSRTKSMGGTLKRNPEGSFSMRSLPRALSRFSQGLGMMGVSCGSIDDLPTTIPSMSPLLGRHFSRGQLPMSSPSSVDKIGHAVQEYVEQLAQVREGENACFGMTLRQFVSCTKDTKETDPSVVVRNVRQFINGMKNYLVKHGEGDLHRIIDEESARLNSNQILNIDAVLEAVLHKLLLREVKPLLYHVMVREHSKSGTLQMISSNIGIVRKMTLSQLGFAKSETLTVPSQQVMEQVKLMMRKMQSHYSPLKKLENLMKAVSMVVSCQNKIVLANEENTDPALQRGIPAADDLVRWLVYILARTSTVGCEVEAWYMWELLPQPMLMQSDASYYLTALFSAVHVLKSADSIKRLCQHDQQVISSIDMARHCCSSPLLSTATLTRGTSANIAQQVTSAACDAFVKIAVPDETSGCVRYATFPGVPLLTTSKMSRLVAHQQGITNPEEHGLYLIADGFESCLQPTDCPVMIHEQLKNENKPHLFAYKRHEAKIAWPRAAISIR